MSKWVHISVDVDAADVLDGLSDQQLLDELESRCIEVARKVEEAKADTFTPLVEEALDQLQQGRADDARLTLERALYPKWKSPEESFSRLRTFQGKAA